MFFWIFLAVPCLGIEDLESPKEKQGILPSITTKEIADTFPEGVNDGAYQDDDSGISFNYNMTKNMIDGDW